MKEGERVASLLFLLFSQLFSDRRHGQKARGLFLYYPLLFIFLFLVVAHFFFMILLSNLFDLHVFETGSWHSMGCGYGCIETVYEQVWGIGRCYCDEG